MESWRPSFHYGYDVGMLHALFTTTEGNFKVRLFDTDVPNTVANFAGLAEAMKEFTNPKTGQKTKRPFYDGTVFHRVIRTSWSRAATRRAPAGGPGYKFADEFHAQLRHTKPGLLSMANAAQHQRKPVLHHRGRNAMARQQAQHLRRGRGGHEVVEKIGRTATSKPGDRP